MRLAKNNTQGACGINLEHRTTPSRCMTRCTAVIDVVQVMAVIVTTLGMLTQQRVWLTS